ncbi:MAG: hypothetical protein PGN11_02665 [Quadrisphaera sp.]
MLDVDHIDPDRWIVVIDAQAGPFSTETGSARHVDTAARDAVAEVLHVVDVELSFVDIDGHPRSPPAEARAARLPRRPLQSPSDSGERPLVDRGASRTAIASPV